jgi:hypothetical protein
MPLKQGIEMINHTGFIRDTDKQSTGKNNLESKSTDSSQDEKQVPQYHSSVFIRFL